MMKRLILTTTILLAVFAGFGQDTLPKFTVKNLGNNREGVPNVVISWVNPFETLKQVSIQTSHDSIRNYRTLISLTDPNAKMNGFADKRAPNDHMFYRLFVVKGNGEYFFTQAKKPFLDTAKTYTPIETVVAKKSPDNPIVKKPDFTPSFYVYTNKDGYVFINLPDAEKQQYHIKFFEEDNSLLFEVKNIKQPALTLDKTNFHHAGWFNFELYNDDKLIEKHKFYLNKDF
ncbi:MAG TPA: hypothetical protein VGN63_01100 [Flavisolibacter sp.]|jgi:hypothetical protein|nr:hypothetical protein [Flavisolibacter sp.]